MAHVCLRSHTDQPALFCGDTLFNAGAGNCHNGGHPSELYKTFSEQLERLPASTLIYPGHDYIENNLKFTLDREPDNRDAADMLGESPATIPPRLRHHARHRAHVNTFFRLSSPTVIARLREAFPTCRTSPTSARYS
jgi:hydroxyacylglutathione hydrolase